MKKRVRRALPRSVRAALFSLPLPSFCTALPPRGALLPSFLLFCTALLPRGALLLSFLHFVHRAPPARCSSPFFPPLCAPRSPRAVLFSLLSPLCAPRSPKNKNPQRVINSLGVLKSIYSALFICSCSANSTFLYPILQIQILIS